MNINVGISQFKEQTPAILKNCYRLIMFLSGLFMVIQGFFHFDPVVIAAVNRWLMAANAVIYFTCQFFGLPKPTDNA